VRVRPVQILKALIGLILLGAVGVIVLNFVQQSRLRPRVPLVTDPIASQKVETTDQVQHFQLRKGKLHLQVRAAKHYIGADGLFHLEGEVRLTFPARADGEDVVLTASEIVHDQENSFFRLQGKALLQTRDLEIRSEFLEYQTEAEVLITDHPMEFVSERIAGSADRAEYRTEPQRLILRDAVKLQVRPASQSDRPVLIQGERVDYWHKRATGTIRGGARFDSGPNQARAALIRFDLFSNRENIKSLTMSGDVHIFLQRSGAEGPDDGQSELSSAENMELSAQEIQVRAWHNSQDIRSLKAARQCTLRQEISPYEFREVDADRIEMAFNRRGELKTFLAQGGSEMLERSEGESRTVRGESFSIAGRKKALRVKSHEDLRARIRAGEYEVEADTINILLKNGNLEADGRVHVIIAALPQEDTSPANQAPAVGFFSGDGAVFINADSMRYLSGNRRFLLKDNIRVWQAQEMLLTQDLVVFRETGRLTCSKGVKTYIMGQPGEEKEEHRLEINADALEYNPEDACLAYTGNVAMKVEEVTLNAEGLYLFFTPEKRMRTVAARGDVRMKRPPYELRGREAEFDFEKEVIVFTGNPVLIDKERGRVEGDKLTFHMADDRIVVENKGRERSETIIKS
jgi:lipopolysaccharide transport protein LptA